MEYFKRKDPIQNHSVQDICRSRLVVAGKKRLSGRRSSNVGTFYSLMDTGHNDNFQQTIYIFGTEIDGK